MGKRGGALGFPPPLLTKRQNKNQTRNHQGGEARGGKIPSVSRSLARLLFLLGVQPSPEARWKGRGESLQAKMGRKLLVAFLATNNINNNKRSPPSTLRLLGVPSPGSGGWERGSITPPRSFSNDGTWSRPALLNFSSFSFPLSPSTLHLFFFLFFLSFLIFFCFAFVFLSCLLALRPGLRSPQ